MPVFRSGQRSLPLVLGSDHTIASPSERGYDADARMPALDIALGDHVSRLVEGAISLMPQWEQLPDGTIRDYRPDIYIRGMELSFPSRRGSLFDMSYAALAEQAGTTMWTID